MPLSFPMRHYLIDNQAPQIKAHAATSGNGSFALIHPHPPQSATPSQPPVRERAGASSSTTIG